MPHFMSNPCHLVYCSKATSNVRKIMGVTPIRRNSAAMLTLFVLMMSISGPNQIEGLKCWTCEGEEGSCLPPNIIPLGKECSPGSIACTFVGNSLLKFAQRCVPATPSDLCQPTTQVPIPIIPTQPGQPAIPVSASACFCKTDLCNVDLNCDGACPPPDQRTTAPPPPAPPSSTTSQIQSSFLLVASVVRLMGSYLYF